MLFKSSAPGSLMLLGEYAVLNGKPALVCAVNQRIEVKLTPRTDKTINISSSRLGNYSTNLDDLSIEQPFQFVLATLKYFQGRVRRGCDIVINSEFSDTIGLGSSAAVTAATLAAVITWKNIRVTPIEMIRMGRNIVRSVQTVGSGADIAAAVLGGVVAYQTQAFSAEKLAHTFPIAVWYAGFKTPTVQAIRQVQANFSHRPELFRHITNSIGQCAVDGIQLIRKQQWQELGEIMKIQQGILESLGVGLPILRKMLDALQEQPGILGAKISGSGLGDCVVGLGESRHDILMPEGVEYIPVEMTLQGVQCEKN